MKKVTSIILAGVLSVGCGDIPYSDNTSRKVEGQQTPEDKGDRKPPVHTPDGPKKPGEMPGPKNITHAESNVKPNASFEAKNVHALEWDLETVRPESPWFSLNEAKNYCDLKGNEWRLPTVWELTVLFSRQRGVLGATKTFTTWTSTVTYDASGQKKYWFAALGAPVEFSSNHVPQYAIVGVHCVRTL
ncbi:MAG: hypothetical protein JKY15_06560 [Deltaproteobacteria bacterium]|nr:hypothetical protein [Deltaproteobacteria bacterium]